MIRLTTILLISSASLFSQQNAQINGTGSAMTINKANTPSTVRVNYLPQDPVAIVTINQENTPPTMYVNYRSQVSNCDALAGSSDAGWINFSDGTNQTIINNSSLYLLDNVTTVENQTKVKTTMFEQAATMTLKIDLTLAQLNNSANMDDLSAGDGYGETNETGDDNINRSGLSFAIIHPLFAVRPIFSIVKAVDYATSNNIEIWGVYNSTITPGYVAFERIYSGAAIPMNDRFTLELDYNFTPRLWPSTDIYIINIRVGDETLVSGFESGMTSNYAGNGSFLFQCKGTAAEPAEYYVHRFEVISRY